MNIASYLWTCFLGGMIGVFWLLIGFKLFDYLTPGWEFEKAFGSGPFNGGSLVVAAYIIGLALVISRVAA